MTDTQKLLAEAEKARLAYEDAETKAAAQAAIEKAEAARREVEFYVAQVPSLSEGPAIVAAAVTEWGEAVLTGDLQTAYVAWRKMRATWAKEHAWSALVHNKLAGIEPQRRELRQRIKVVDGKIRQLQGNLNRGEAVKLKLHEMEQEAAKLRQRLEELDSYDLSGLGHPMQITTGDFSADLQRVLRKPIRNDVAAYIHERTAGLRAAKNK
jgi:hypothetical protein